MTAPRDFQYKRKITLNFLSTGSFQTRCARKLSCLLYFDITLIGTEFSLICKSGHKRVVQKKNSNSELVSKPLVVQKLISNSELITKPLV